MKTVSPGPVMKTEALRRIALALPEATEAETWNHPTFRVHDHIFVGMDEDAQTATIKATKETQAELVAAAPDTYEMAPRVGQHGWVLVHLSVVADDELRDLVTEAWRQTAPESLVADFDR